MKCQIKTFPSHLHVPLIVTPFIIHRYNNFSPCFLYNGSHFPSMLNKQGLHPICYTNWWSTFWSRHTTYLLSSHLSNSFVLGWCYKGLTRGSISSFRWYELPFNIAGRHSIWRLSNMWASCCLALCIAQLAPLQMMPFRLVLLWIHTASFIWIIFILRCPWESWKSKLNSCLSHVNIHQLISSSRYSDYNSETLLTMTQAKCKISWCRRLYASCT